MITWETRYTPDECHLLPSLIIAPAYETADSEHPAGWALALQWLWWGAALLYIDLEDDDE